MKDPITGKHVDWNPSPQKWIDGSVDNDLPMTRLAELFNVNHFIVSQVNPHVVPFLAKDDNTTLARDNYSEFNGPGWLHLLTRLAKDEALHRLHLLAEFGVFPTLATKARSVLSQKYSGDINIFPAISYADFPRMLANPTISFMKSTCLAGERATWPKLSRIENHCKVELALDAAVQRLRAHVVFSPSATNLRRLYAKSRGRGMRRRVSNSSGLLPLFFSFS
jgi:TAG lipase/steryl ester hydrolase/phospholipase A2/LPA acyltransferase